MLLLKSSFSILNSAVPLQQPKQHFQFYIQSANNDYNRNNLTTTLLSALLGDPLTALHTLIPDRGNPTGAVAIWLKPDPRASIPESMLWCSPLRGDPSSCVLRSPLMQSSSLSCPAAYAALIVAEQTFPDELETRLVAALSAAAAASTELDPLAKALMIRHCESCLTLAIRALHQQREASRQQQQREASRQQDRGVIKQGLKPAAGAGHRSMRR